LKNFLLRDREISTIEIFIYRSFLGPKVVPQEITSASIENLTKMLQRKPVIWDNIHANDYDDRRVFLGPFKGRPLDLYHNTSGLLTNPNCEFEANFVAFESLAQWYRIAGGDRTSAGCCYDADDVFDEVCEKWINILEKESDFVVKKKSNEDLVVKTELASSFVDPKSPAKDDDKAPEKTGNSSDKKGTNYYTFGKNLILPDLVQK